MLVCNGPVSWVHTCLGADEASVEGGLFLASLGSSGYRYWSPTHTPNEEDGHEARSGAGAPVPPRPLHTGHDGRPCGGGRTPKTGERPECARGPAVRAPAAACPPRSCNRLHGPCPGSPAMNAGPTRPSPPGAPPARTPPGAPTLGARLPVNIIPSILLEAERRQRHCFFRAEPRTMMPSTPRRRPDGARHPARDPREVRGEAPTRRSGRVLSSARSGLRPDGLARCGRRCGPP